MRTHLRLLSGAFVLSVLAIGGCGGSGSGGGSSGDGGTGTPSAAPARAIDSLTATGPVPADAADRSGDLLLTRLSVVLADDATAEQLEAAMARVGSSGIAYSVPGSPFLTLSVPRQNDGATLLALAELLQSQPGILFAAPGRQLSTSHLPYPAAPTPADSELRHLLLARFPAAWNAAFDSAGGRRSNVRNCTPAEATVIVADHFESAPFDPAFQLAPFVNAQRFGAFQDGDDAHGWQVAATLASAFDEFMPTGATPLPDCVDFVLVDVTGLDYLGGVGLLRRAIGAQLAFSRLIVNVSMNFSSRFCGPNGDIVCTAEVLERTPAGFVQGEMATRVWTAMEWAASTDTALDERLLMVQAAGNDRQELPDNGDLGTRYGGIRRADLASPIALATRLESFDQLFSPASEVAIGLWTAGSQPSLLLTPENFQDLHDNLAQGRLRFPTRANMIVVGSATNPESGLPEDITESGFSNEDPAILAVGEDIIGTTGSGLNGTSFAAPQVAGLAAWLWTISNLDERPASETATHIKSTTAPNFLLDAYAATLALDVVATIGTVGIREALMDVNGDDRFDELDLQQFAEAYGLDDPDTPTLPETRDYGRFDLNGDGATGGIPTYAFDLDRSSIIPGPAPVFSTVQKQIEGYPITFNEAALSDVQILCYYAYSSLYVDDEPSPAQQAARTEILGPDHCVFARMYANFPARVNGASPLDVTVELPAGDGQYRAAPDMHVDFTPSCGSVDPASGRTDAEGHIRTTVTPDGCGDSVSVTAVARANEGTTPLAQQTVTATVGAGESIHSLSINVGSRTPGLIEVLHISQDGGQELIASGPVGDAATVMAEVETMLAGVSEITGAIGVIVQEPVSLTLSVGLSVGSVYLSGSPASSCGSSLHVTVGDVRSTAGFGGCLGDVTLATGDVGDSLYVQGINTAAQVTTGVIANSLQAGSPFANTTNQLVAEVQTQGFNHLTVRGTVDSTINIQGSIERHAAYPTSVLYIGENTNLKLGPLTGGTIDAFTLQKSSFVSPPSITVRNVVHPDGFAYPDGSVIITANTGISLDSIHMGDIDGDLTIRDNRDSFSDQSARNFAGARTVGGNVSISGNSP